MIKIQNLNKIYNFDNKQLHAVKDVNLNINKGDIFGVIGLSGAGKSSLIRCINLLEKPTSGNILIDDVNIINLKEKELRNVRKKIGMIFQHFNLLMNATVYDNVAFALKICGYKKDYIDKKVKELLSIVGLEDKKDYYPSRLSGGQKQRVSIARALANDPSIILCDEATSALDPTTTDSILTLLKDINAKYGITVVLITHEMNVIKSICNKVAVMESGVIVEEGKAKEVFLNPQSLVAKRFLKERVI